MVLCVVCSSNLSIAQEIVPGRHGNKKSYGGSNLELGSSTNREGAVILCVSRARLLDGRLSGLPGMDKQSNRGESAPELITPVIMA